MIIKKILNNNVVISTNENDEEIVVMGRGIAFQKNKGDEVNTDFVEKVFTLAFDDIDKLDLLDLVSIFNPEEITLSKKIIQMAEEELGETFSDQIYITLTDHLHYAMERQQQGIVLTNPLLYDIKRFYPDEYEVARRALLLINEELGVNFPNDEAGFLALHFVSSSSDQENINITMESTEIIRDILNVISRYFGILFNEKSLSYSRMVTHIQFFVRRILTKTAFEEDDEFLLELVKAKYPKAYQCSLRIRDYLKQAKKIDVQDSELIYLIIHINRVIMSENENS